jgi:hypothetical protein
MAEATNHGYFEHWSEVSPVYDDIPVHVPSLKALIAVGSIVKLADGQITRVLKASLDATDMHQKHVLYGNLFVKLQDTSLMNSPIKPFIHFI